MSSSPTVVDATGFTVPGYVGQITSGYRPPDLEAEVGRLTDPATAIETLHWGRNYLYVVEAATGEGPVPVVVKQFRNQGWRRRLKRRWSGSKAERSWRGAAAVLAAGVPTPAPMALIESVEPEGPSFYVCQRLSGFFEARYYFRAMRAGREEELFAAVDRRELLKAFGRLARRLHDARIWYRDLSIGNLLIRPGDGDSPLRVYLVDLNRARLGRELGTWRRMRDVSRLPILEPADQRTFLEAYWGGPPGRWAGSLYRRSVAAFLARNRWKDGVRAPLRALRGKIRTRPRHAHVHIPAPREGASARDKSVWDPLTDQPHQHASRWERNRVRIADLGDHLRTFGAAALAAPRIHRRYRRLRRELYSSPVSWGGMGLAIRPEGALESQLKAIEELGAGQLLLRLHPWQDEHRRERELARELHGRGYELAFALPQNRELVSDIGLWRESVARLAETFTPYGRHFQIGQAINRSKWGVWSTGEYLELAGVAAGILRRYPEVEILGPAVIDFEFHYLAGVLNRRLRDLSFDVVSALLYVDRRGAPESEQLGFDTVGKAVLLRALADTARNAAGRAWVTEVNWPLWEGPHSPAGKDASVDEGAQADYLVRYYLAVLTTGLVERVYWWRLFARGYGLIDSAGGRRRPSFRAFRTLRERLEGAVALGPLEVADPARGYRFRDRSGGDLVIAWSLAEPVAVDLPSEIAEAVDRDGRPQAITGDRVTVGSSPVYLHLR